VTILHTSLMGSASVRFTALVLPPGTHCLTISAPWLILLDFENC